MIEKLINICKEVEQPERTFLYLSLNLWNDIKQSVEDSATTLCDSAKLTMCNVQIKKNIYLEHDVIIEIVMAGENIDKIKVHRLNK